MLPFSATVADSHWSLIFSRVMLGRDEICREWPVSSFDIQQPLKLISNNNHDGKCWQIAFFLPLFPSSFPHPSPPRRLFRLHVFVPLQSPVLPHSSLLSCLHCLPEGRWPRVCWLYQQPCIVLRGGFRLSKHLPAAAFAANTKSGISPFLSLRR